MRMDPTSGPTAADIVNTWSVDDLSRLFAANGEGRFATPDRPGRGRGASVRHHRRSSPRLCGPPFPPPPAVSGGHPARRVFQAIRIAVNDELDLLAEAIPTAIDDARAAAVGAWSISYHSGEDRIVKAAFSRADTGGCVCPPGLPCACGAVPVGRLLFRGARRPTPEERARNRRAESARLRAIERLDPAAAEADGGVRGSDRP